MKTNSRIRYAHVNIIARDWKNLMRFYVEVFDCVVVGSQRDHRGKFIDELTGIEEVRVIGQHLRVPGYGDDGPTIEIFTYNKQLPSKEPGINRPGFAHIAFEVDDFESVRQQVLESGGKTYGGEVTIDVAGAGRLTLVYMTDPEGNIVELQRWHAGDE